MDHDLGKPLEKGENTAPPARFERARFGLEGRLSQLFRPGNIGVEATRSTDCGKYVSGENRALKQGANVARGSVAERVDARPFAVPPGLTLPGSVIRAEIGGHAERDAEIERLLRAATWADDEPRRVGALNHLELGPAPCPACDGDCVCWARERGRLVVSGVCARCGGRGVARV